MSFLRPFKVFLVDFSSLSLYWRLATPLDIQSYFWHVGSMWHIKSRKKVFWKFSFFTILGSFSIFLFKYVFENKRSQYLACFKNWKRKKSKILKIDIFRGIFIFFLLYLYSFHRSPHSTYEAIFWHVGSLWLRQSTKKCQFSFLTILWPL